MTDVGRGLLVRPVRPVRPCKGPNCRVLEPNLKDEVPAPQPTELPGKSLKGLDDNEILMHTRCEGKK